MPEQIALITGATSGIGQATAATLSAAGWTVWVTGRSQERAEMTAARVGGRPLQLDVTDQASVLAAAAAVTQLDLLVNNAGIQPDFSTALVDADAELFRRTYETNVFAVVTVTTRSCRPCAGHPDRGSSTSRVAPARSPGVPAPTPSSTTSAWRPAAAGWPRTAPRRRR
jgi:NAD(P)-dependent dehydrogenase (short-subunit alcohol dehydrogenase family)